MPVVPASRLGDVWQLGRHCLVCGDSTDAAVVERVLNGVRLLGRGHYHWQHEPCWYAVRGQGHWRSDRKQTTLWQIASRAQDAETVHRTQKPVACMRRPIENNSNPGQAIYEPLSGSGTTTIAAEMTGRSWHAAELSPAYVDVAVLHWQAFTGEQATLEADGTCFAAVAAAREKTADDAGYVVHAN